MNYKLLILLLVILVLRVSLTPPKFKDGDVVRIRGRVLQEPVLYDDAQGVSLLWLRMYLPKYPRVIYGQVVEIVGRVEGGKLKDPREFSIIENTAGLFGFREMLIRNFSRFLPPPHSAIVSGVVLGSRESITSQFWERLKLSGTAHVVVASGTNVVFTAGFLMSLALVFFKRKKAIAVSLVGIWVYVFLSGFDAPLVRAAIMGSVAFSAQALGRLANSIYILLLTSLIMLIVKPIWISDLGFILSFTATVSLILFESKIYRYTHFVPTIIRKDFSTTVAAQIGVSPILLIAFGRISILSPIANALVLWTIPPIMILGAVCALIGAIFPGLGQLVAFLIYPLTKWFVFVVETFS